ncbi:hypothetical protein DFP73DRAFT_592754 [Morchella snyderi]|nr:hypothetical protein DFP73DRAFT_592754 [Morchella snyderi]
MAEAKFVLYDLEKYKRDRGTRWILDTYKRTSAVGGPLDLSQFDPDSAHILWKDQQPTWLRDGGVIFRAFHIRGDSVPPGFVLGIVIKEKLDLELAQFDSHLSFISEIFISHGWMIIDLWIQEENLYLDIELDINAIYSVNGDVEDYLEPARYLWLRDASLSRGLHQNPNRFVLVLTFQSGIPSMPRNRLLPSETQLPAPRSRSPEEQTSHSPTNESLEDRSITPTYSSGEYEADTSASPPSVASDPAQTIDDYTDSFLFPDDYRESMTDDAERLAARLDAEYRLTGGTTYSDRSTFHSRENNLSIDNHSEDSDGYSSGAALSDLLRRDGQSTFGMANNEEHLRNAAESNGFAGSYTSNCYADNPNGNNTSGQNFQDSRNEIDPQLPAELAEPEVTEGVPSGIDSDGFSPPRHKAKDLGEYLGVFQKPLKKSQHPPSQSSSSEESVKGSGSKSKFLPGMFKSKEKPTSSSEGGANSPRRLVKTRPAPPGTKSGAAQGGSFSRATGPLANSEHFSGRSVGRATGNIANADTDRSSKEPVLALPAVSRTGRPQRRRNRDSTQTINQEEYMNGGNSVNSQSQISNAAPVNSVTRDAFSTSSTSFSSLVATNEQSNVATAAAQTPAITPRVFPAGSWQGTVRGNYEARINQAEDDYEASAQIDEFEVARRADEERARTTRPWPGQR